MMSEVTEESLLLQTENYEVEAAASSEFSVDNVQYVSDIPGMPATCSSQDSFYLADASESVESRCDVEGEESKSAGGVQPASSGTDLEAVVAAACEGTNLQKRVTFSENEDGTGRSKNGSFEMEPDFEDSGSPRDQSKTCIFQMDFSSKSSDFKKKGEVFSRDGEEGSGC